LTATAWVSDVEPSPGLLIESYCLGFAIDSYCPGFRSTATGTAWDSEYSHSMNSYFLGFRLTAIASVSDWLQMYNYFLASDLQPLDGQLPVSPRLLIDNYCLGFRLTVTTWPYAESSYKMN